MSKERSAGDLDPRVVYADIIDLPCPRSAKHPPMSLYDRAAQFSPFAALSGYEEMIGEEARLVDNKIELGEEELEEVNRELGRIDEAIRQGNPPAVTVTYFIPDPLKAGGIYETVTEKVRRVDPAAGTVQLDRTVTAAGTRMEIRIEDILDIRILNP